MSFQKIGTYLSKAFNRIDKRQKDSNAVTIGPIHLIIGCETIDLKNGILIVFSESATLKQKIHLTKKSLITRINQQFPHLHVHDITFKGPK